MRTALPLRARSHRETSVAGLPEFGSLPSLLNVLSSHACSGSKWGSSAGWSAGDTLGTIAKETVRLRRAQSIFIGSSRNVVFIRLILPAERGSVLEKIYPSSVTTTILRYLGLLTLNAMSKLL